MQDRPTSASHQQEGRTALHDLVRILASEVGELAQAADRLQPLFGQLLSDPPVRPADTLERAQALDGLVQRLQGLETFLTALGERRLEDVSADARHAAHGLSLTSQAHRFAAAQIGGAPSLPLGDCDLF